MRSKFKYLSTVTACLVLLSGCGGSRGSNTGSGGSLGGGFEFGPLEVSIRINSDGTVALNAGLSRKARISLGPVSFKFGIDETVDLTRRKPYHLFILWKDNSDNLKRDEYEIGKKFRVTFDKQDWVREIRGENDSIIVAVEKRNSFQIDGVWMLSFLNNTHLCRLYLNGSSGTMKTAFQDGLGYKVVEQDIDIQHTSQGIVVEGSNPILVETSQRVVGYSPDTFLFQQRPDGSISVSIRDDNLKMWLPVYVQPCSPNCQ
jgi:hypothetical protein